MVTVGEEINSNDLIDRLRNENELKLEDVRNINDLKEALRGLKSNPERTQRGLTEEEKEERKQRLIDNAEDMFEAEPIQNIVFENINEDINTKETISELNKIKIQDEIKKKSFLEEKKKQKESIIRKTNIRELKRLRDESVDIETREFAMNKLAKFQERGDVEFSRLNERILQARSIGVVDGIMEEVEASEIIKDTNKASLIRRAEFKKQFIEEGIEISRVE